LALNVYENLVIFDPNKYAQDPGGVSGQIPELVAKCGGEVLVSRLWQEQRLAFPIDGHKKGTYWLSYFRLDGSKLVEFNRALRINDVVVRSLTLKVEPRLVEALVEHAKGGQRLRPSGEPTEGAAVAAQPA
jgi:small subunit ribosomal protein S6